MKNFLPVSIKLRYKFLLYFITSVIFFISACGSNEDHSDNIDTLNVLLDDSVSLFDLDSGMVLDVGIITRQNFTNDLDSMIKRGYIRVLVPTNRTHYFLDGAQQRGMIYEHMMQFEKFLNRKLKRSRYPIQVYCIPSRRDQIFAQLVHGFGDIASAGLTVTEDRQKQVEFCQPMDTDISEVIVAWKNAPHIGQLSDLAGREVLVRKSSTYFKHLVQFNQSLHQKEIALVKIKLADENLETEDLLELVNSGLVPYTIADDYLAKIWRNTLDSLIVYDSIPLHSGGAIAHAVRKNNPKLQAILDEFMTSHKRGTLFGNIIHNRYLVDNRWIENPLSDNVQKKIAPLLDLFKKYGEKYQLDYIFLCALAYQESKFDQKVRSHAGAVGIMQVLPKTAANPPINIKDISSVENNIHAGSKYLRYLMDTYFNDSVLTDLEKMYFTMASYNAGPTRISRLRRKAASQGYDPDQWFDNVEILVAREVGREPVNYVTNILKNYIVYTTMVERIEARGKEIDKFE